MKKNEIVVGESYCVALKNGYRPLVRVLAADVHVMPSEGNWRMWASDNGTQFDLGNGKSVDLDDWFVSDLTEADTLAGYSKGKYFVGVILNENHTDYEDSSVTRYRVVYFKPSSVISTEQAYLVWKAEQDAEREKRREEQKAEEEAALAERQEQVALIRSALAGTPDEERPVDLQEDMLTRYAAYGYGYNQPIGAVAWVIKQLSLRV